MPPKTHKETAEQHLRLALKEIKMVKPARSETPEKKRSETPKKKHTENSRRPRKKKMY
jgi:hypothetical protein